MHQGLCGTRPRSSAASSDDAKTWFAAATPRVNRYLRCLHCPRDTVADLVQETLLAGVRAWPATEPPLPWLLVTARNLWLAHCRRARRGPTPVQIERLHERATEELGSDGGDARLEALRVCLEELPPQGRSTLQLYYRDGLTRRQVAAELGLSEEGVKSRLERLKAVLKVCVQHRSEHDA